MSEEVYLSDSFGELRSHLEGLSYEGLEGVNSRVDSEAVLEDVFNLLDASEMFLSAAVYHDSAHSYELGEVAFDDLAQKISVLALQHPEDSDELHDLYMDVRRDKKAVDSDFQDVDSIVERTYREVSISLDKHDSV